MPALTAFKRSWNIGSDDFVFPGITMLFIRSVWLVTIAAVYGAHEDSFNLCEDGNVLQAFYIGMIILLTFKAVVNVFLVFHSSRGSIKDCSSRRNVAKVLYVKLFLFILELFWLVIGSFWATAKYENCDWVVVTTVRVLVALAWIGVIVFIIMFVFLFSPLGGATSKLDESALWRRRCQLICCSYKSTDDNQADAYTDIANLVSGYFQDVDLVPTDIAAGLLLVGREQRKNYITPEPQEQASRQLYIDRHQAIEITNSTDIPFHIAPWMTLHKAAKVMRYALASYGWPLYSLTHMPFGCCVLCCTSPKISLPKEQRKDDMCSCNLVSIEKTLHPDSSDVYYASFSNKLFVNPFIIFADHEQRSIVVAIRGTLSLKDAMVDITAFGEEIGEPYSKSYKAHKGMLKSAQNLAEKLKADDLLRNAFMGQCSGYGLVICGHSLGAGVAAILTMLLKADFPYLQCFAFSPPGGLFSEDAYRASREHTMSVILGDDLVPRLSIQTMQDLKVNIMTAINDCPYPKYKIFLSLPFRALQCNKCLLDEDEESMSRPLVGRSNSKDFHTIERSTNHSTVYQEAVESRDLLRIQPPFYPPGCIMYILPSSNLEYRPCCTDDTEYSWRWADQTEFLTLKVTPKMGGDHMPNRVLEVLNMLIPDYPEAVTVQSPNAAASVTA